MDNPFSIEGKRFFITGASSGIGKSIAVECAKLGAHVVVTGRDEIRLTETYNSLSGSGHEMYVADLSKELDILALTEKTHVLDGLVNCAGISFQLPFQFISKDKLDKIFALNCFSPILLTQSLLKKKKIAKPASVVFISSISGVYCSSAGGAFYSATKGAISGLIKGMALDLASKGIRVNSINPGVVETNIFSEGTISEEQLAEDMKKYPLKRFGRSEEIAHATIYLLSQASAWMTGSEIKIDGGYTLL